MKFAGNVVSRLGRRLLIVESDAGQLPPLYTEVADEQSRSVGKIVDLYGSVSRPYLTVLCSTDSSVGVHAGDKLYVISATRPEKSRKTSSHKYGRDMRANRR
ncbi:Gar1/Naf1 family protein [uncultured Methanocorpusculum sp.]|nr:Gar1/Naf1 family protein [uncultured Methanocorpusculum sp.]